jgi:2'-5' RNA ligase superfamily
MPLTRHHATAFLGLPASHPMEELRRTWDPEMARQIAAHVTLIYPEEIADPALLTAQAAHAADHTGPFTIMVEAPFHSGSPADGIFMHVSDPDQGIARFRATAMPADHAIDFPAHITLVHPRTSSRGMRAWADLADVRFDARITIAEVAVTAYDGDRWLSLQTIPLTGP